MKRAGLVTIVCAVLLAAGCSLFGNNSDENGAAPEDSSQHKPRRTAYTHKSLLPRDIRSIRIDIAENPTFRREFELPITKAIINEIQSSTDLKITDGDPDSVLEVTLIDVSEHANVEDEYDVPVSGSVKLAVKIKWTDLRTGRIIPLMRKTVSASEDYNIGRGDTFYNAAQQATEELARLVVESMYEEW